MVQDKGLLKGLTQNMGGDYYRRRFYQETNNIYDAVAVFKFASDNTSKEWKFDIYDAGDGQLKSVVATNMDEKSVDLTSDYNDTHAKVRSMKQIVDIHSHPDENGTKGGSASDRSLVNPETRNAVYHKATRTLFEYNRKSSSINSIKINSYEDLYKYIIR